MKTDFITLVAFIPSPVLALVAQNWKGIVSRVFRVYPFPPLEREANPFEFPNPTLVICTPSEVEETTTTSVMAFWVT